MAGYFNEIAYKAWYRQYQVNLNNYINHLNVLRLRIDNLPESNSEIEHSINVIYEKVEKIIPRNFSEGFKPLEGSEKFFENFKVLVNLIFRLFHCTEPFRGIYKVEKERVMKVHHEFQFKENLIELKHKVDILEAKLQEEIIQEPKTENLG